MAEFRSLSAIRERLWREAVNLTAGGSWSIHLPETVQRNLRWFFFDGVFSSASDGITIPYLALFVLSLGATRTQIGLMTALASLSAVLAALPRSDAGRALGQT